MSNRKEPLVMTEQVDINDSRYYNIVIDEDKIIAKGSSWKTFVLMLSAIDAVWIEKRRKYGGMVFIFGLVLAYVGMMMLLSILTLDWIPSTVLLFYVLFYGMFPLMIGSIISVLWFILKNESMVLYTPSGQFRFEAPSGLLDRMFEYIKPELR